MRRVLIELSDAEIAIIDRWERRYLSPDTPHTIAAIVSDMLRKIKDDMRDMEEVG